MFRFLLVCLRQTELILGASAPIGSSFLMFNSRTMAELLFSSAATSIPFGIEPNCHVSYSLVLRGLW